MPIREQMVRVLKGIGDWNEWRDEYPQIDIRLDHIDWSGEVLDEVNFSGAYLHRSSFRGVSLLGSNLEAANLSNTYFEGAYLRRANLSFADLTRADLTGADLIAADLTGANLSEAILNGANLSGADLTEANLEGAELVGTLLLQTEVHRAVIRESLVYGINVWDLRGEFEDQTDLVITPPGTPLITVDNIKVAQFIYLILNNEEIRDVINTLTSKTVLILGRFTSERKAVLNALKNELRREYNLLPIVFDFERPPNRDFTETIKTMAGFSCFVIVDVTNPNSSPFELEAIVPEYEVPFVPIIQEGERPFPLMANLQKKYPWVLETLSYKSIGTLLKALKPAIIDPAIQKQKELRLNKAREIQIRSASDFVDDDRQA